MEAHNCVLFILRVVMEAHTRVAFRLRITMEVNCEILSPRMMLEADMCIVFS